MSLHLQRAWLLMEQERFGMAEEEIRRSLSETPQDPLAHSLLAITLVEQKKLEEALSEAKQGIHLGPDIGFAHYALARVHSSTNRIAEAIEAMREALHLDPEDPAYYAFLSSLCAAKKNWKEALEYADRGLQVDPEHVGCMNMRAMTLIRMGRRREAGDTMDYALSRNPENALSHTNRGWTHLEEGEYRKAMDHFQEALRLDPRMELARDGIVEAMKARNPLYRLMLRYFLRMARLSTKAQWMILLGALLAVRFLRFVADEFPALVPWVNVVLGVYIGFVFLSWSADSIFNLLLRLNRFGRYALHEDQIRASNWIGLSLLLSLASLIVWFFVRDGSALVGAAGFAALVIPISGVFRMERHRKRRIYLAVYTVLLALLIPASILLHLAGAPAFNLLVLAFVFGIVVFTWLGNFLSRG